MTDEHSDRRAAGEPSRRSVLKSGALAGSALALGTGAVVAGNDSDGGDQGAAALTDHTGTDDGSDDETETPFASVQFSNQESNGTDVVVDSHTLSESGYVAFHDPSLLDGEVAGSVIGVTDYQEPGIEYRTEASLYDVPGGDFDETELTETTPIVAMPHRETSGNEEYNFLTSDGQEDGPFTEAGLPVVDLGHVVPDGAGGTATDDGSTETETPTEMGGETETPGETTETEDGAPFAAVDFANQNVSDDTVVVGEVVLSDGGFVALHDARLLEGQAIESVVGVSEYLEAGKHRNVEVTLDDPDQITEVALPAPPLVPMPHEDTNGNEEYDFVTSEGADDGPYTEAGEPVVDIGLVNLESDAGTETETGVGAETETDDGTETDHDTPTDTDDGY
ncbi:DUF7282 domain-containing protein [Halosimplex sp. J119]